MAHQRTYCVWSIVPNQEKNKNKSASQRTELESDAGGWQSEARMMGEETSLPWWN